MTSREIESKCHSEMSLAGCWDWAGTQDGSKQVRAGREDVVSAGKALGLARESLGERSRLRIRKIRREAA